MRLFVLTVTRASDPAMNAACARYMARLPKAWKLEVRNLRPPAGHLPKAERIRQEGERLIQATPRGARCVALSRSGQGETSAAFSQRLERWRSEARDVAFVIGGVDGLDQRVLSHSELVLSLSPLTFPHGLAQLILIEQLYRASTILHGTPYHRGR
jgi:23S rRNA (pseudouridine1915-N3)-methyltransferase